MKARVTKNLNVVLERAAELLPGTLENAGVGMRRLRFTSMGGAAVEVKGSIGQCLFTACNALLADPRYDGFGESIESVRDALQLHPGGIPNRGLAGHEEMMLQRVSVAHLTRGYVEEDEAEE